MDTLHYNDEDELRTQIKFVKPDAQNVLSKCPSGKNVDPKVTFRIQQDDSTHSSTIKYRRTDTKKDEGFTFNKFTDHTHVVYDGHSLTCTGNGKGHHQCNHLPEVQPVPVIIYEIDFNPRDGNAKGDNWSRNKYTLLGNYYVAVAQCQGKEQEE